MFSWCPKPLWFLQSLLSFFPGVPGLHLMFVCVLCICSYHQLPDDASPVTTGLGTDLFFRRRFQQDNSIGTSSALTLCGCLKLAVGVAFDSVELTASEGASLLCNDTSVICKASKLKKSNIRQHAISVSYWDTF